MIIDWICLGLMAALVVDVFLGVFSRYVLHATFQWYDEVARLCFVWMVFLGAAVAVRRGAHFRLHLLIDRFGPRLRRATDLGVALVVLLFGVVLVAGGVAMYPVARRQLSDSLELSMLWFHGAVPVGGALMVLFSLPHLWRLARADERGPMSGAR